MCDFPFNGNRAQRRSPEGEGADTLSNLVNTKTTRAGTGHDPSEKARLVITGHSNRQAALTQTLP
jgi:hypothetical protein